MSLRRGCHRRPANNPTAPKSRSSNTSETRTASSRSARFSCAPGRNRTMPGPAPSSLAQVPKRPASRRDLPCRLAGGPARRANSRASHWRWPVHRGPTAAQRPQACRPGRPEPAPARDQAPGTPVPIGPSAASRVSANQLRETRSVMATRCIGTRSPVHAAHWQTDIQRPPKSVDIRPAHDAGQNRSLWNRLRKGIPRLARVRQHISAAHQPPADHSSGTRVIRPPRHARNPRPQGTAAPR